MRKTLFVLTTVCLFGAPAFAQQSPTGQSSGGPARVGTPGQITAPPSGGSGMMAPQGGDQTMTRASRSKKMMRSKRGKRAMMRSRRGRM